ARRRGIRARAQSVRDAVDEREDRRRAGGGVRARSGGAAVRPGRRQRAGAASERGAARRQFHAQPGMPAVPRQVRPHSDAQGRRDQPARHRRQAEPEEGHDHAAHARGGARLADPVQLPVQAALRRAARLSVADGRVQDLRGFAPGRFSAYLRLSNFVLVACLVVALWIVFVPVWALFYNAFTEDTGFGPGAASLDNFREAYASWYILRLFRNSFIFAV